MTGMRGKNFSGIHKLSTINPIQPHIRDKDQDFDNIEIFDDSDDKLVSNKTFDHKTRDVPRTVKQEKISVPDELPSDGGDFMSYDSTEQENNDDASKLPSALNISRMLFSRLLPREVHSLNFSLPTLNEDRKSVIQKLGPPRKSRAHFNETQPERQTSGKLEEIFDLFDPYKLYEEWNTRPELEIVSGECRHETEIYLKALHYGELWAIRMWDASGHYSGGYFFGNPYWMGSRTSCREIPTFNHRPVPFKLGFSVVRFNLTLNMDGYRKSRYQFLGLCLPYSCSKLDIQQMAEVTTNGFSTDIKGRDAIGIVKVKSPHDRYNMYQDPTFWLIIISSLLAGCLLLIGTMLDLSSECGKTILWLPRFKAKYKYCTYSVNPPTLPLAQEDKQDEALKNPYSRTVTPTSETDLKDTGIWHEVFLSFSVWRNMKQICDSSIGEDTIPIIHGLRSISMAWVILGHTCIVAFKYSDNMEYRKVAERELLYQTINNTAFTVDTFFFISGLLVSFLYFRTTAKVNVNKLTKTTGFLSHCIEFVGLLGYRFCRLTVPYIYALGLVELCMKWFYYNSVFDPPADDHINCPNYWWRNLLYINTLFPVKDMCMLWSWYLADDTQFYVLGIILLITAIRHFKLAAVSVTVLLVASWCTTGYIAYINNHMPNIDDPLALFDKIYDKPWTRFGPYLIGMAVGWILFKTDCKLKMKKVTVISGWLLCAVGMLSLVYGLHKKQLDSLSAAAYSSLSHTAWALGLSWIVIACSTGHGGVANKFLSSRLLIPFSRTTYCAYLIHPIIIRLVIMRRDSPVHLAEETIGVMFLGQLTASYILAFVLSVAFEAPIVSLLKIVSPTKRSKTN